jgi:hypothetical protein
MSKELDQWRINEGLVRLVLFRVLPGHEVQVGRLIERKCNAAGISKGCFRIFRLFGSYDLLFIQDGCKLLDSDFVSLGSIAGITASTEYVCYKWQSCDKGARPTFAMRGLSKPLVGLCFLKINPLLTQRHGLIPELDLAEFFRSEVASVQMLGTMGWSEVILVIPDDSLEGVLRRIGQEFPNLIFRSASSRRETFAEKTLTMIGHDLDVSDPKAQKPKLVSIPEELRRNNILEVHFSASCTPRAMTSIEAYAQKHFKLEKESAPRVTFRLGVRDLDFKVAWTGIKTLNDLLSRLDQFRLDNRNALIRTHTELQYRITGVKWPSSRSRIDQRKTVMLRLSPAEARKLVLRGPAGTAVATAVYHFNNLVENPLLLDAFSDMARALKSLKQEALKLKTPLSVATRSELLVRLQYLQQAISQRYQGAYLGVEEAPWGASFGIQQAGMGIQRILKALELYAGELLLRLGKRWGGFVLVGRHRSPTMEHSEDILLVPPGDALDARKHWAMSHEIMHILQFLAPDQFSLKSLRTPENNEQLSEFELQGKLLQESMTDIMEFRLSCTCPVHKYLEIIWRYLKDGVFELTSRPQLSSYLIRSFAVFYDSRLGGLGRRVAEKEIEHLFHHDFMKLLNQFSVDLSPLRENDEQGQSYLRLTFDSFVENVLPYLPLVRERVDTLSASVRVRRPSKEAVAGAVARLKDGRIVSPDDMILPDAIAWELVSRNGQDPSSSETIAWLLSLWHYYQVQKRGPDLSLIHSTKSPSS